MHRKKHHRKRSLLRYSWRSLRAQRLRTHLLRQQ
jgi:hypothetical protein